MTRVIKIGGRPQNDPRLAEAIASGWNGGERAMVLVHGGGDEVTTLQAALGETSTFVDGRRVTSARDIDLVRMALSGSANKRLVSLLVGSGIDAVGLSGEDASLIGASPVIVANVLVFGAAAWTVTTARRVRRSATEQID